MAAGREAREEYRECMRNHAATVGVYAVDGCTEYTPDAARPASFSCEACGCHRNFHRKVFVTSTTTERPTVIGERSKGRRRTRTKFSAEQKARMASFAEKIGWRLKRRDDGENDEVSRFCREIGVTRQVFKVWLHNHKSCSAAAIAAAGAVTSSSTSTAVDHGDGDGDGDAEGSGGDKSSPSS